ncbi:uncharacterized protein [Amphiura filiformis]|uniref:uncharacterized protein n=1 Tax=Amphiura filiformis TaxID=82378 RepID=UPI003B2287A8
MGTRPELGQKVEYFHDYAQRAARTDQNAAVICMLKRCWPYIKAEEECAMTLSGQQHMLKATIAVENSIIDAYASGLTESGAYLSTFQVGQRMYTRYLEFGDLVGVTKAISKDLSENLMYEVMTSTDLQHRRQRSSGADSSTPLGRKWDRITQSNKYSVNNTATQLTSLPSGQCIKHLGLLIFLKKKQIC